MNTVRLGTMVKLFGTACLLFLLLGSGLSQAHVQAAGGCTHFVATNGDDLLNAGTSIGAPWKTIQKAANIVGAGSVVCVRAGTYPETVAINVSGSEAGGYITFQNYSGEQAILDRSGFGVPAGWGAMIAIGNRSYVIIKGFEIRNYKTSLADHIPVGILVSGAGSHIELRGNLIHHIETNYGGADGGDAHGIAVYGTSGATPLSDIVIAGNELHNLKLGSSEALVVNGNVNGFQVTDNIIHDSNNIGIDAIGFEGTAPANDQARNGLISGNVIFKIDTYYNPAYSSERSAACIYVDGGTLIVIENNTAHNCNLGVELASEHQGRSTSYVTLRNNIIYDNTQAGIAIGGYDTARGSTQNCTIVNNTLRNNTTQGDWGMELFVQYDTRNNVISNNVFSNPSGKFLESWSAVMSGNQVNHNLYFSTNGNANGSWMWKGAAYGTFASYRTGSGNDADSLIGSDPLFVDVSSANFELQPISAAINAGNNSFCPSADKNGSARPARGTCDLGAFESNQFAILGNAGAAYVVLTYTDGIAKTVTADAAGSYVLGVSVNWSGTVTPFKTGYIFSPPSRAYVNVLADQTAQDYTAIAPPENITLSNSKVRENLPIGTVIGSFKAKDLETNDRHTFNLQSGVAGCASTDNHAFQIAGARLYSDAAFDYESKNEYEICVRVTDSHGMTLDKPFTVRILDVRDETPPQTNVRYFRKRSGTSVAYVFIFISSERNSKFLCAMDAGAYVPCSNLKSYDGLSAGAHTFQVYAVDASGNADPTPASVTFTAR